MAGALAVAALIVAVAAVMALVYAALFLVTRRRWAAMVAGIGVPLATGGDSRFRLDGSWAAWPVAGREVRLSIHRIFKGCGLYHHVLEVDCKSARVLHLAARFPRRRRAPRTWSSVRLGPTVDATVHAESPRVLETPAAGKALADLAAVGMRASLHGEEDTFRLVCHSALSMAQAKAAVQGLAALADAVEPELGRLAFPAR